MAERETPGQRIRNLREAAFITQKDFAERIGVAPSQLSRIESGETKTISSDILIAIATEFDVSTDYLLGLSTFQKPRNVDVTMTGLSEVAFNRMVNGEMDMDVLNRLIEHKHFSQLTKMIRIYFADELEYGIQSRNMMLDVLSGYRQVLCANSFTSLAELSLHRAGKPALNYLVAEDRERVKATTRRKLFAIR